MISFLWYCLGTLLLYLFCDLFCQYAQYHRWGGVMLWFYKVICKYDDTVPGMDVVLLLLLVTIIVHQTFDHQILIDFNPIPQAKALPAFWAKVVRDVRDPQTAELLGTKPPMQHGQRNRNCIGWRANNAECQNVHTFRHTSHDALWKLQGN